MVYDALALLTFALLEAFPFRCPELQRFALTNLAESQERAPRYRNQRFRRSLVPCLAADLSCTSGELPIWALIPVLQSFKEQGSWRDLLRGCRPLEVCVLILTVASKVSDRLT